MRKLTVLLAAFLLVLCRPAHLHAAAAKIIFDTDMAEDVDDVGALAILHALADRNEAEILACMISAPHPSVGPCIDALNTWFGRPEIPIGNARHVQLGYPSDTGRKITSKYAAEVAARFPHRLAKSSDAPDAVSLYRKILAAQPDRSVTIVTVGFLTNLKDLLNSGPDKFSRLNGENLVAAKVKEWVCMGGKFPDGRFDNGNGEYNVVADTSASVRAINDWPTPVFFSGFEIGVAIKTGGRLQELPESNPVRLAFQLYTGGSARESWDETAVLFAVRGARNYWKLSEPGFCLMHARVPEGYNEWIASTKHKHRYLIRSMEPEEIGREIDNLMLAAAAQKRSKP